MHIRRRDWKSNPGPLVHSAGEEPLRYLLPQNGSSGVMPWILSKLSWNQGSHQNVHNGPARWANTCKFKTTLQLDSIQSNKACCMLNIHIRDRPQALLVSINVPIANLATVRLNRTPHVDIGLFIIRETAARYIIELTVEKILAHARIQWKVKIWSKKDKKRNESNMSEVIKVGGLWVQSCLSWHSKSGKWYL